MSIACRFPSDQDMEELPRVWLTVNEVPWNSQVLDSQEQVRIPLCWDGESKFQENLAVVSNNMLGQDSSIHQDFVSNVMTYLINTSDTHANPKKKPDSIKMRIKKEDYKALRPFLGWLPTEVVK